MLKEVLEKMEEEYSKTGASFDFDLESNEGQGYIFELAGNFIEYIAFRKFCNKFSPELTGVEIIELFKMSNNQRLWASQTE